MVLRGVCGAVGVRAGSAGPCGRQDEGAQQCVGIGVKGPERAPGFGGVPRVPGHPWVGVRTPGLRLCPSMRSRCEADGGTGQRPLLCRRPCPWPALSRRYQGSRVSTFAPGQDRPGPAARGGRGAGLGAAPRALPRRLSEPRSSFVPGLICPFGGQSRGWTHRGTPLPSGMQVGRPPFYFRAVASFPFVGSVRAAPTGGSGQPHRLSPVFFPRWARRISSSPYREGGWLLRSPARAGLPTGHRRLPDGAGRLRREAGSWGARGEQTGGPPGTAAAVANGTTPPRPPQRGGGVGG